MLILSKYIHRIPDRDSLLYALILEHSAILKILSCEIKMFWNFSIYGVPVNKMTKGFIWVDLVFIPLLTSLSGEK